MYIISPQIIPPKKYPIEDPDNIIPDKMLPLDLIQANIIPYLSLGDLYNIRHEDSSFEDRVAQLVQINDVDTQLLDLILVTGDPDIVELLLEKYAIIRPEEVGETIYWLFEIGTNIPTQRILRYLIVNTQDNEALMFIPVNYFKENPDMFSFALTKAEPNDTLWIIFDCYYLLDTRWMCTSSPDVEPVYREYHPLPGRYYAVHEGYSGFPLSHNFMIRAFLSLFARSGYLIPERLEQIQFYLCSSEVLRETLNILLESGNLTPEIVRQVIDHGLGNQYLDLLSVDSL